MQTMFSSCSGLTSLDVSGLDTSKVTNMSYMFSNCSGLTHLNVSGNYVKRSELDDIIRRINVLRSDVDSLLQNNGGENGGEVLYYNPTMSIENDRAVNGFDTSKVTNMESMFSGCSGLTSLDLSGFNTSNVTNMSNMFKNCSSLTNLDSMQNISVSLDLSATILDVTSLLDVIDNLTTVTTTQTLTLGSTLLAKLSEDQIAIATNKGWTVV